MNFADELQKIYDSEINIRISWLWDGGIDVWIGDDINGYVAQDTVASVVEIIPWLQEAIAHFYPNSNYAESLDPSVVERGANRLFQPPRIGAQVRSILGRPEGDQGLQGYCFVTEASSDVIRCRHAGGADGRVTSDFEDAATQMAGAMGCPPDVDPVAFWIYRVALDLVVSSKPEVRKEFVGDSRITPLHLSREWKRLLKAGGRHRRTKEPRPLSAKTVRNIAGVVSSAFAKAIKWGLVKTNPVLGSDPPVPKKRKGIGLTVAQKDTLIEAASGPWCIAIFLELDFVLGARRGETMALRWSDIVGGRALISRSITQTKDRLEFKDTKTGEPRVAKIPEETLAKLGAHRKRQDEFRAQFGPAYRSDLDLIFAKPDGSPLKPDSISATVSALFKRLKIPKPKGGALHLLRHSLASQMLASGVPLPVVSQQLGHSSVRVTADIYAHAIHGQDDEAVAQWEEYQRRNRANGKTTP